MKKLLLLYNPKSGRGEIKTSLSRIIEIFSAAEYDVTVYPTKASGDAARTIRKRAPQFDLIVCSGGDGTLDEVVTGLMESGAHVPIGYIPSGSTNDFANSVEIPLQKEEAAEMILKGSPYPCDVGRFNKGDYFVYVAAFGVMTGVSYQTGQDMKNILGYAAYVLEGIRELGSWQSYDMEIESEEFTGSGSFIYGMVSNSNSVAGIKGLPGEDIILNDGLFEVMFVRTPADLNDWQRIISALMANDESNESLIRFKTRKIKIRSSTPVAWTRDGENGGEHLYVELENLPRAFEIIGKSGEDAPEQLAALDEPDEQKQLTETGTGEKESEPETDESGQEQ